MKALLLIAGLVFWSAAAYTGAAEHGAPSPATALPSQIPSSSNPTLAEPNAGNTDRHAGASRSNETAAPAPAEGNDERVGDDPNSSEEGVRETTIPFALGYVSAERSDALEPLRSLAMRAAPSLRCVLELTPSVSNAEGRERARFLAGRRVALAREAAVIAGMPTRRVRVQPLEMSDEPYGEVRVKLTGECP